MTAIQQKAERNAESYMAQTAEKPQAESRLELLNEALGSGAFLQIRRMLNGLPPVDAAHLIESTPQKVRGVLCCEHPLLPQ